jgi:hypothetical protein
MLEMLASVIELFGRCFKRGSNKVPIRTGCVYRRIRANNAVETATVLDIHDDPFGIPHVKYKVTVGRSDRSLFWDCKRVLALQSFAELYDEMSPGDLAAEGLAADDLAVAPTS